MRSQRCEVVRNFISEPESGGCEKTVEGAVCAFFWPVAGGQVLGQASCRLVGRALQKEGGRYKTGKHAPSIGQKLETPRCDWPTAGVGQPAWQKNWGFRRPVELPHVTTQNLQ